MYDMNHKERGHAFIFNMYEFGDTDYSKRLGSEKDVTRLAAQLRELGFKVTVYTDYKRDKISEEMVSIAKGTAWLMRSNPL